MSKESTTSSARNELERTPFAILGVSVRDTRARIVEAAEDRSLHSDQSVCNQSKTDLINPRNRLGVEIAWLPGLSPSRASQLCTLTRDAPESIIGQSGIPTLAHANLLASALELIDFHNAEDAANAIDTLARLAEEIDVATVVREINEDRLVSGFPAVKSADIAEEAIKERKRSYKKVVRGALDRLTPGAIIETMTLVASAATSEGRFHAPELVDELVDSYEVEVNGLLEREAANVKKLKKAILDAAPSGELAVRALVDKMISVVSNWDSIAQPIQISAKARGINHEPSSELAYLVRGVAIELFNEHQMLDSSMKLSAALKELFAELPEVHEQVVADSKVLAGHKVSAEQERLLSVVMDSCNEVTSGAERHPASASERAALLAGEADQMIAEIKMKRGDAGTIDKANDAIAAALISCAIEIGNSSEDWPRCIEILKDATRRAKSEGIKAQVLKNLAIASQRQEELRGLTPVRSAPSLFSANGIGMTLYGSTDRDVRNGSFISTYYLIILAIPLFPLARYRVTQQGNSYRFLGKAPLRPFDWWHIAITCSIILALFLWN